MRKIVYTLLFIVTVASVFAEEFSDIPQAEIDKKVSRDAAVIPLLVAHSSAAGVGMFIGDCSTTNVSFVDISVQQWWTPVPGTNTVRISKIKDLPDEWIFPANVPVVFFAKTKAQWYGENVEYFLTNATERAELTFGNVDRSWFRTTRDSGLVYTFSTNLWDCLRTNLNLTNYYEVLRDAERTVSKQDSWRVHIDASKSLSWFLDDTSESYLAEKLNDPLLSPVMKGSVRATLYDKFGWRYVNGIITPPQ